MRIEHHGAYLGVTGSCHQLFFDDERSILVDCGLFQGLDAKRHGSMEIDFSLEGIESLILTHVHVDHVGRVPYLYAAGFRKPIYCTKPTAKLLPIMLEDAMRLGFSRDRQEVKKMLKGIMELIRPVAYEEWVDLGHGDKFRMQQAGHILGSAYVEIEHTLTGPPSDLDGSPIDEESSASDEDLLQGDIQVETAAERSRTERYVFSGDLGSRCVPILKEAVSPERADVLILESTYGDRIHEGRETRLQRLEAILCETLANNGVTLIPSFSLGRTQELLFELNQIMEEIGHKTQCSLLKQIDIIVDSPLALKLTDIYDSMKEYWSDAAHEILAVDSQPMVFKNLVEVDSSREHRQVLEYLLRSKKPAVVIAGSGMCTGGRIVNYLKAFLDKETTDVVFVGYQGLGTPGRSIQDCDQGKCDVRVDQMRVHVKAKTYTLAGYSAHADQSDLIRFVENIPVKPREIRLVHGETAAKEALAEKLTSLGYSVTWQEDDQQVALDAEIVLENDESDEGEEVSESLLELSKLRRSPPYPALPPGASPPPAAQNRN